jgi:hypothetical protein
MFFRLAVFFLSFFVIPFIAAQSTASTSNNPTSTSNDNSPTSAPTKNPKRGLAFAAGDTPGDLNNANQTRSVITWIYDWDRSPAPYLVESHIEYVPMQWGAQNIETFGDVVKSQGAKAILVRIGNFFCVLKILKILRRPSTSQTSRTRRISSLQRQPTSGRNTSNPSNRLECGLGRLQSPLPVQAYHG